MAHQYTKFSAMKILVDRLI